MARQRVQSERDQRDQFWWRAKVGEPVHTRVVPYGKALLALYKTAHSEDRALERMYEGRALRAQRTAVAALATVGYGMARLNALKAVVDTFVSRMSKDRPMPSIIADDGDWNLKQKAQQFRKFVVGKMLETEFDDLSREALNDGTIIGTGLTRVDDGDDDVYAERMLRRELLFDPRETRYGRPSQAIYIHRISRAHLAERFPKFRAAIDSAAPSSQRSYEDIDDGVANSLDLEDYVDVFEAWHLPTMGESDDGRRVLCIDTAAGDGTLVSEQWHEPRFPWAMYRLAKPRTGVWGCGLVYGLADIQHRVNSIVRDMQLNLQATGRGFYAVNEAADIPTEMLTGLQPFKLKYKGNQPPQFTVPTAINPAQLEMLKFFISQMFDLSGVSQAAATSKSALGAGASGAALDTQYDIDSERFAMAQANYARYRLDGGQAYIDAGARVARRRAQNKGEKRSWVATWRSRDAIERLEYDKVSLDASSYRLQLEPVNFLPDTRAGKLSMVGQLAQAGVIPQWLVATLFDEPDLQQANAINLAAFKNCMRKMDELVDAKLVPPIPEPYNDLDLELKISTAYYNRRQEERAPLEIQERYRNYIDQVQDLIDEKKKAANSNVGAPIPGAAAGAVGGPAGAGGAGPDMPGMQPMLPSGAAMPATAAA